MEEVLEGVLIFPLLRTMLAAIFYQALTIWWKQACWSGAVVPGWDLHWPVRHNMSAAAPATVRYSNNMSCWVRAEDENECDYSTNAQG